MDLSIDPAYFPLSRKIYKADNPNLGIALIFCNTDEMDDALRIVMNENKTRLGNILDKYGFEVRVHENLDHGKMTDVLEQVSKEDHSQNDCFLTTFMLGDDSVINVEDLFSHDDDLFRHFSKDGCTLKNKPKLSFIDIRRGNKTDPGAVYYTDSLRTDSCTLANSVVDSEEYFIPKTADLFIHFSTYKGYVNWHNPSTGSWFIQSLSDILEKFYREIKANERKYFDLYELATAINRKVAYSYDSESLHKSLSELKMMPIYTSSLTKLFSITVKPKTH